jgi:hypothetical protein
MRRAEERREQELVQRWALVLVPVQQTLSQTDLMQLLLVWKAYHRPETENNRASDQESEESGRVQPQTNFDDGWRGFGVGQNIHFGLGIKYSGDLSSDARRRQDKGRERTGAGFAAAGTTAGAGAPLCSALGL